MHHFTLSATKVKTTFRLVGIKRQLIFLLKVLIFIVFNFKLILA